MEIETNSEILTPIQFQSLPFRCIRFPIRFRIKLRSCRYLPAVKACYATLLATTSTMAVASVGKVSSDEESPFQGLPSLHILTR